MQRSAEAVRAQGLTAGERERYEREGVVFPCPALDPPTLARALAVIERLDREPPERRRTLMVHKTHLVSRTLWDILFTPAIVERVADLVGPDVLVWGAGFFTKEPHSSAFVSWHQDATYWGLEPEEIVTAWVAMTPSIPANGCMRVVPGSHLKPLPHVETYAADNLLSRGQEIAVQVDEAQALDVSLQAGQMSLHHVRIAHNSEPNRSDIRRIGFAIRYVGGHVRKIGARDQAVLVRGRDTGHFDLETPPKGEFEPVDLARHAASRAGAVHLPPETARRN